MFYGVNLFAAVIKGHDRALLGLARPGCYAEPDGLLYIHLL